MELLLLHPSSLHPSPRRPPFKHPSVNPEAQKINKILHVLTNTECVQLQTTESKVCRANRQQMLDTTAYVVCFVKQPAGSLILIHLAASLKSILTSLDTRAPWLPQVVVKLLFQTETADIQPTNRHSTLPLGPDCTQSNPELRRKQGQSSV